MLCLCFSLYPSPVCKLYSRTPTGRYLIIVIITIVAAHEEAGTPAAGQAEDDLSRLVQPSVNRHRLNFVTFRPRLSGAAGLKYAAHEKRALPGAIYTSAACWMALRRKVKGTDSTIWGQRRVDADSRQCLRELVVET